MKDGGKYFIKISNKQELVEAMAYISKITNIVQGIPNIIESYDNSDNKIRYVGIKRKGYTYMPLVLEDINDTFNILTKEEFYDETYYWL